jgi:hypothetical protein
MKTRICRECGKGRVRVVRRKGRFMRYRTMDRVEVPADIGIPTCRRCGAEWVDDATARKVDAALERSYRVELVRRARAAILQLTRHVTSHELESLLGLSHGYLSKLKCGDRVPSPDLVAELGLLARKPAQRVNELRAYWKAPLEKVG